MLYCSECHDEFFLPLEYSRDTVVCPGCFHHSRFPGADFVNTVRIHKFAEKKTFAVALAVGVVLFADLLFLLWLQSPFWPWSLSMMQENLCTYGAIGGGALLLILFLRLLVRFESNRWEVYF